jgi:hypothetical protein
MAIYQQSINKRLWEMPDSFINVFVPLSDKLQLFFDFVQQDEADLRRTGLQIVTYNINPLKARLYNDLCLAFVGSKDDDVMYAVLDKCDFTPPFLWYDWDLDCEDAAHKNHTDASNGSRSLRNEFSRRYLSVNESEDYWHHKLGSNHSGQNRKFVHGQLRNNFGKCLAGKGCTPFKSSAVQESAIRNVGRTTKKGKLSALKVSAIARTILNVALSFTATRCSLLSIFALCPLNVHATTTTTRNLSKVGYKNLLNYEPILFPPIIKPNILVGDSGKQHVASTSWLRKVKAITQLISNSD